MREQKELFKIECAEAHGKSIESLRYSKDIREKVLQLFDYELPMSIMKAIIRKREYDLSTGSYKTCDWRIKNTKKALELGSHLAEHFAVSGQSVRMGRLSQFPQNIGKCVLRLYSKEGDVVIDPFAGHNSRMQLVTEEGRHYCGYDISKDFMKFNVDLAIMLRESTQMKINLYEQDSRFMIHTENESADFTLTSPPYYDLEDYGDEKEQLGKTKTYKGFLDEIAMTIKENYRILKKNAYCVWFINDFRRRGIFHSYHVDLINIFNSVGFTQQDLMVVDLGYPIKAAFASQILRDKILPKRHEYGIIFQKQ